MQTLTIQHPTPTVTTTEQTKWDQFGRTGKVQVLHVALQYADGSKGEINLTSPHIIWSEDIETQYLHLKKYIASQYKRLGVVSYQAYIYAQKPDGTLEFCMNWGPADLTKEQDSGQKKTPVKQ